MARFKKEEKKVEPRVEKNEEPKDNVLRKGSGHHTIEEK